MIQTPDEYRRSAAAVARLEARARAGRASSADLDRLDRGRANVIAWEWARDGRRIRREAVR